MFKKSTQVSQRLLPLLFAFAFVGVGMFVFVHAAKADYIEPICPGGSNPRPDIVYCEGFETLGITPTPQPSSMRQNVSDGTAAVGIGYTQGVGIPFRYGTGYAEPTLPQSQWTTAINERFYLRFTNGHISYGGEHGPGPQWSCGSTGGTFNLAIAQSQPWMEWEGSCGAISSFDLMENQPTKAYLQNNRWYLIEIHEQMDRACSDISSIHGCNGVVQVFVDGQKVLEYTDLNLGGVYANAKFTSFWTEREYFHASNPPWGQHTDFDSFVVSNTGQYIGPAQNENPRGTADPVSPYKDFATMWPMYTTGTNDCQWNHNSTQSWHGADWGVDAFDGTLTHGAYPGTCLTGQDGSLKVATNTTNSVGGLTNLVNPSMDPVHPYHQVTIHGWMYLASGNDYSTNPALSGLKVYDGCCYTNGKYIAMGIDSSGNYDLIERGAYTDGKGRVLASSTVAAQPNTWTEFQVTAYDDNTATLMINRNIVLSKVAYYKNVDFVHGSTIVLGVIDNQGSSNVTVNYDEVSEGSFSWWNCDGWDPSSCPFSASTVGTPTSADTSAPSVSLTGPNPGSTISGSNVTLAAVAADNVGVVGVQFKVDGTNYGAETTVAPYQVSLDTTKLSNGTHTITATARDAAGNIGNASPVTVTVSNTTTTPTPTPTPSGSCPTSIPSGSYLGCYYTGINFDTFTLSRNDPSINFDWSTTSPDPSIPTTLYSVRWQGNMNFEASNYTFTATGDDGVRLYIDGTLVIDKWVNEAATTYTYSKDMTAGSHLIKLEYYQNTGYAVAKLSWAKNTTTTQTPPPVVTPTTTVVVDSTYSGYDKKYINDGIINASAGTSGTWASSESSTSPHYIEFDLPSATQVNNALISWAFNSYSSKYMASNLVQVQVKDSSGNWITQGSINYAGDVPSSTVAFAPVTTSAIRFYQPANEGNPSYTTVMWVTEVSYSYDPSKTPVVTPPVVTPPVVTPPVVTPPSTGGVGSYVPSTPQTPSTPPTPSSYATGTLVNDNGTIYLIRGGFKIGFTNPNAFLSMGYKFSDVVNGSTSSIPSSGYNISSSNQEHPWGTFLLYNHTVYYSTQAGMVGVPSLSILQNNGGDLSKVLPANSADIAIIQNSHLPVMTMGDARVMH